MIWLIIAISAIGTMTVGAVYYVGTNKLLFAYQPTDSKKPPRFLFAIEDRGPNKLGKPSAVAVSEGRLYVGGLGAVSIFTRNGRWLGDFSLSLGRTGSYLPYAHDMAADADGRLYVTVGPFNVIMVYDRKGRIISGFPSPGKVSGAVSAEAGMTKPIGIHYDQDTNSILVSDVDDHAVKEYAVSGRFLKRLGRPGNKPGTFTYPNGIVTGKNGVLYVADSNNGRVQVFERGRFMRFLEPPKDEPFVRPKALAIDKFGRVHVVDSLKSLIYVFAPQGRFLFDYGGESETEGRLTLPTDIAIDSETGQVFIADRGGDRVLVWAK